MDHAVLVDIDVNLGAEILGVLDSARAKMEVALWATFTEFYSPRLVMAAEWLDAFSGSAKYGKVRELLDGKLPTGTRPTLLLLNTTDPFVLELREQYGQVKEIRGMRLYGQSFGGRYVEDGYIYRIA